jgi:hypothetical protein
MLRYHRPMLLRVEEDYGPEKNEHQTERGETMNPAVKVDGFRNLSELCVASQIVVPVTRCSVQSGASQLYITDEERKKTYERSDT